MPGSSRTKQRAAEIDAEMTARARAIAVRTGRAPSPVRTRIDPRLIRRDLPPKEKRMPATVTDTHRQRVLACVEHLQPVRPANIAAELGLGIEVVKLALRDLIADELVAAEGKTRARVYSLASQDQPADQPADCREEHDWGEEDEEGSRYCQRDGCNVGRHSVHAPGYQGPKLHTAGDPPPLANTPDLDDPDDFAGNAGPLDGFAHAGPANAEFTITLPKLEFAPDFSPLRPRDSLQESYARLLISRLTTDDELDVDLLDRVERLILLEVADRDDAEGLIERARAIGAIK